ncbi:MAG: hypothetical protein HGB06_04115 [Chlorobaculum sp.]|jgi:hypothetical protein|nr:hypothetical protein [Chlorobaculum sp.]
MSRLFYHSAKKFIENTKNWGFAGPALLSFSILNVKGYELDFVYMYEPYRHTKTADRQHFVPPEAWIEEIDTVDIDSIIRPLLDTLWQAFGVERCLDFDDKTGKFAPRQ